VTILVAYVLICLGSTPPLPAASPLHTGGSSLDFFLNFLGLPADLLMVGGLMCSVFVSG